MNYAQRQDVADSVEAGDVEVLELQHNVEMARKDVQELSAAADALGHYRDVVVEATQYEPLSNSTARLIQTGVSDVCRRIGLTDAVVSTESEDGVVTISVEAINDRLKKIWEGIKLALVTLSNNLGKLFARFLDTSQKTVAKAQDIESKLGNGTKNPDEPIEMDLGNLVVGTTIPGNFPSLAVDTLKQIGEYVIDNGAAEKFLDAMIAEIRNSPIEKINSTENALTINKYATEIGKRLESIKGSGPGQYPAYGDQVVMSTGKLLGNSAIVCISSKPGSTMVNTLQQFNVLEWREERPSSLPKSITPLTAEQIRPILASVKETAMRVSSISSYLDRLRGYTEQMTKLGENLITKTPEDKQGELALPLSQLSRMIGSVTNGFDVVIKYNVRLSNTLTTLCAKSLA